MEISNVITELFEKFKLQGYDNTQSCLLNTNNYFKLLSSEKFYLKTQINNGIT